MVTEAILSAALLAAALGAAENGSAQSVAGEKTTEAAASAPEAKAQEEVIRAPSVKMGRRDIELAVAHRRAGRQAALELRLADKSLMARCFDDEGLPDDEVELASLSMMGTEIFLFQGPRQIARGQIETVETSADSLLPCAVMAVANFDRPLPITAKGDILWATNQKLPSSPRETFRTDVEETARLALPPKMAEACLSQRTVARRGTVGGTYVGFVCVPEAESPQNPQPPLSALVFIPKPSSGGSGNSSPRLVLEEHGEYGSLTLVDVLNPRRKDGHHRLAMLREWTRPGEVKALRRIEIWEDDGARALPSPSENPASDMMFLLSEEARRGGLSFDPEGTSDSGLPWEIPDSGQATEQQTGVPSENPFI